METKYIPKINTVYIKPIGNLTTRKQLDSLVLDFKKIHGEHKDKFWIISDVSELMVKSTSLLKYFAEKMIGMDEHRYGTVFILQDFIRRTGIRLLRYYRKVNFHTAYDLESAIKIIKKGTENNKVSI